jgi:hypothetical protein
MRAEKMIDDLIEAGWFVLESDFDTTAFGRWRRQAFKCVEVLMGADHPYTLYFKNFVLKEGNKDLLAGEGILTAIKEHFSGPRAQPTYSSTEEAPWAWGSEQTH